VPGIGGERFFSEIKQQSETLADEEFRPGFCLNG